jgi:hypothetical protein
VTGASTTWAHRPHLGRPVRGCGVLSYCVLLHCDILGAGGRGHERARPRAAEVTEHPGAVGDLEHVLRLQVPVEGGGGVCQQVGVAAERPLNVQLAAKAIHSAMCALALPPPANRPTCVRAQGSGGACARCRARRKRTQPPPHARRAQSLRAASRPAACQGSGPPAGSRRSRRPWRPQTRQREASECWGGRAAEGGVGEGRGQACGVLRRRR